MPFDTIVHIFGQTRSQYNWPRRRRRNQKKNKGRQVFTQNYLTSKYHRSSAAAPGRGDLGPAESAPAGGQRPHRPRPPRRPLPCAGTAIWNDKHHRGNGAAPQSKRRVPQFGLQLHPGRSEPGKQGPKAGNCHSRKITPQGQRCVHGTKSDVKHCNNMRMIMDINLHMMHDLLEL